MQNQRLLRTDGGRGHKSTGDCGMGNILNGGDAEGGMGRISVVRFIRLNKNLFKSV